MTPEQQKRAEELAEKYSNPVGLDKKSLRAPVRVAFERVAENFTAGYAAALADSAPKEPPVEEEWKQIKVELSEALAVTARTSYRGSFELGFDACLSAIARPLKARAEMLDKDGAAIHKTFMEYRAQLALSEKEACIKDLKSKLSWAETRLKWCQDELNCSVDSLKAKLAEKDARIKELEECCAGCNDITIPGLLVRIKQLEEENRIRVGQGVRLAESERVAKKLREALEQIEMQADFNDNPWASDFAREALALYPAVADEEKK